VSLHKITYSDTVLALALRPQAGLSYQLLLIIVGSLLVALSAQIEIPMWPVPVTLQTLAVLLVGGVLGSRLGALSLMLYLFEGAIGLPVFAGGAGSLAHFAGPTAGYLFGFMATAYLVGWFCERGWDRHVGTAVFVMLLGTLTIYLLGLPWLAQFTGWDQVWQLGLLPFIPGDILKAIIAATALPLGWKLLARR
jgi:biotin transport system substrate-specific component